MGKSKKKKEFDVHNMTPDEQLKFEIAQELGLDEKVLQKGWKSLTSKESGRIGGMITGRKRQLKEEALKESRKSSILMTPGPKDLKSDESLLAGGF